VGEKLWSENRYRVDEGVMTAGVRVLSTRGRAEWKTQCKVCQNMPRAGSSSHSPTQETKVQDCRRAFFFPHLVHLRRDICIWHDQVQRHTDRGKGGVGGGKVSGERLGAVGCQHRLVDLHRGCSYLLFVRVCGRQGLGAVDRHWPVHLHMALGCRAAKA
jgi:hypothetical protein